MAEKFTVLKQEQVIARLPDQTFGPVIRVTFRTATNVVQSVDVPLDDYSKDAVVTAITERVEHVEAIQNL